MTDTTATTPTEIKVGMRLRNGAVVLQSTHVETKRQADDAVVSRHIILALSHAEFVTWTLFVRDDLLARGLDVSAVMEDGAYVSDASWGHYHHDDLARAVEEYAERVAASTS